MAPAKPRAITIAASINNGTAEEDINSQNALDGPELLSPENKPAKKRTITTYGNSRRTRHQTEVKRRNQLGEPFFSEVISTSTLQAPRISSENSRIIEDDNAVQLGGVDDISTHTRSLKPNNAATTTSCVMIETEPTENAHPETVEQTEMLCTKIAELMEETAITQDLNSEEIQVDSCYLHKANKLPPISTSILQAKTTKTVTWDIPVKTVGSGRRQTEKERRQPKLRTGEKRIITESTQDIRLSSSKRIPKRRIEVDPPENFLAKLGTGNSSVLSPLLKIDQSRNNHNVAESTLSPASPSEQTFDHMPASEQITGHALRVSEPECITETGLITTSILDEKEQESLNVHQTAGSKAPLKRNKTRKRIMPKKKSRGRTTMTFVDIKSRAHDRESMKALILPNRDNRPEHQPPRTEQTNQTSATLSETSINVHKVTVLEVPSRSDSLTPNDSQRTRADNIDAPTSKNYTANRARLAEVPTMVHNDEPGCNQAVSPRINVTSDQMQEDQTKHLGSHPPVLKNATSDATLLPVTRVAIKGYTKKRKHLTAFLPESMSKRTFRVGLSKREKVSSLHSYLKG